MAQPEGPSDALLELERRRISRFLHDKVGQNLTALGFQLDLARMDLEEAGSPAAARLAQIQDALGEVMEEVRAFVGALGPTCISGDGLGPAIRELASRAARSFSGSIDVEAGCGNQPDTRTAGSLYHIACEAVDNAVRHSGCTAVKIAVHSTAKGCALEVRDNGVGFEPAQVTEGGRELGLLRMRHYAARAGLRLSIRSCAGGGTVVRAEEETA